MRGTPGSTLAVGSAAVFAAALVLSILAHGGAWVGLMVLPVLSEPLPPLPPAQVEFTLAESPSVAQTLPQSVEDEARQDSPDDALDDERTDDEEADLRRRPRPRPREREREPELAPEPEPEPEVVPPPEAAPPPPPPPPPPEQEQRRAIRQHVEPSAEDPEDAQFVADEAAVVEEETTASVTSLVDDAAEAQPVAPPERPESDEEGDADERDPAELEDREGSDARRPTREEVAREERPVTDPSTSRRPAAEDGSEEEMATPRRGREAVAASGGARAISGGEPEPTRQVVIHDAFGTFVVATPEPPAPAGSGGGTSGGDPREGEGEGERGAGRRRGRAGRRRGGERLGALAGLEEGTALGLSWRQFESIYGEEELERQREAAIAARRSRTRGGRRSHSQRWDEFRAAIENYVPEVRPGRQTALSAARMPFAGFLSDMHRRIHPEFAGRYIGSLPADDTMGLNDQSLSTLLEISINPDGSIYRVGVVETSGNILFDFGAFDAVMRAQPFPVPPSIILSGDGHAWLQWRFDRSPRQCHTWNARPFMLDNGPGLVDRGEPEIDTQPESGDVMRMGPASDDEGS